MQFVEKNSFNVRSAIYHLKKAQDSPIEVFSFSNGSTLVQNTL